MVNFPAFSASSKMYSKFPALIFEDIIIPDSPLNPEKDTSLFAHSSGIAGKPG